MNRLQEKYQNETKAKLKKELGLTNDMMVPSIEKIVINMGIGDAFKDKVAKEKIQNYLAKLSGQKPQPRPSKRSIAEFSTREGDVIGFRITLRGERAFTFLDKLISIVLPRVRDFQGVKKTAFDDQGNYNLGIKEQIIFPEVDYDTIDRIRSLQVTINTTTNNSKHAFRLLEEFGMPFAKEEK